MGAASSSSFSSSASSSNSNKYDVFISFRGEDTRKNFTSHLHTALCQNSIETYIDYRLQKGDDISDSLIQAIHDSTISVVVFSENYASSKWCLDELLQILHCKMNMGQIVIPIFYKIDPSHVRKQNGSYEEAFAKHETDFIHNKEIVEKWRDALLETANLAGWDSQSCRHDSELIQNVVNDILQKLKPQHPYPSGNFVGIHDKCEHIELLLEKVQRVGIWGMGGIGKTTMAKVVFAKLYTQYDGCCFLENLREESEKHGLTYVRDKLLLELQNGKKVEGSQVNVIRSLGNRRLLIVLDDVNDPKQLEYLAEECNCLGPNSRVIITTRDRHLLVGRVNEIYEARELNFEASLKLFNLKAFHKEHSEIGYEQLSERAIHYAQGLPLVLVILGSFLHSKIEEEWESALDKLKKSPLNDIHKVLKLSYDGLDKEEKEMFLDIACFYKGENREHVKSLLDSFGFNVNIGLRTLIDRALITIKFNRVEMHDLMQEMGRNIVSQECITDPGRQSRLWNPEEVIDVLENNHGTEAVEGIMFDNSQSRDICLRADAFKRMNNLRYLKLYSSIHGESCIVKLPSGLESFSNTLSYFHWDNYPLKHLPSTFCPKKLVELHLKDSQVKKLWDGVQDIVNLREVNLNGCNNLLELPDFSKAKKLEKLDLSKCEKLCNVHPSILSLHSLISLNLRRCRRLKSLQSEIHLKSLAILEVEGCYNLKEFSLSSEELTVLDLQYTGVDTLHSSIGRLNKLERLCVSNLKNFPLKELCLLRSLKMLDIPNGGQAVDEPKLQVLFDELCSLERLILQRCSRLSTLPDNITNLKSLFELSLSGSNLESLPSVIKHLPSLTFIDLVKCKRLRYVPELPSCITNFYADECVLLETVVTPTTLKFDGEEKYYEFTFKNCMSLDMHSLNMNLVQLLGQTVDYNKCRKAEVYYPGSTVPGWILYKQTRGRHITFEIPLPFNDFKGFLLCCVISKAITSTMYYLKCQYHQEDGPSFRDGTHKWSTIWAGLGLKSDHVCIWYLPFDVKSTNTNSLKVSFQFLLTGVAYHDDFSEWIKECGVRPIYI